MANVSWSVVIPALIAILCVNAVVSICINGLKNVSGGRKIGIIAIGIGAILVFVSLFCVLVWIMYSTPTRFVFEAIDRLINGVVSGMPKLLVLLWFILPLTVAYLIYALMATVYDVRKRREFKKNKISEGNNAEVSKPVKQAKKKSLLKRSKKQNKPTPEKVGAILGTLVTEQNITSPIQFRRLVNNKKAGLSGVQHNDQYWLIAHDASEFDRLKNLLPTILADASVESYPAVIQATKDSATVNTEQHGINAFRRALRG